MSKRGCRNDQSGRRNDPFHDMLEGLVAYRAAHGHCRVPVRWPGEPAKLGYWCNQQRYLFKTGALTPERLAQLAAIGFWGSPEDDRAEQATPIEAGSSRAPLMLVPASPEIREKESMPDAALHQVSGPKRSVAQRLSHLRSLGGKEREPVLPLAPPRATMRGIRSNVVDIAPYPPRQERRGSSQSATHGVAATLQGTVVDRPAGAPDRRGKQRRKPFVLTYLGRSMGTDVSVHLRQVERLIAEGLRPPLIHAVLPLPEALIRKMWQAHHGRRAPGGQLPMTTVNLLRGPLGAAHGALYASCYLAYAGASGHRSLSDNVEALIKGLDLYRSLSPRPVITMETAWYIARDLRNIHFATLRYRLCSRCQAPYLIADRNPLITCPFCEKKKEGANIDNSEEKCLRS